MVTKITVPEIIERWGDNGAALILETAIAMGTREFTMRSLTPPFYEDFEIVIEVVIDEPVIALPSVES